MASTRSPRPLPPEPPGRSLPHSPLRSRPQSPSSPSFAHRRASAIAGRNGGGAGVTRLEPVPESDSRTVLHDALKPAPLLQAEQVRRRGSSPGLGRQKSKYFEQVFGTSTDMAEMEERIRGQTMVHAELKTSVFVNDEAMFISELATLLSKRYHRPTACIAITLQHGMCMYLAGNFEPSYTLAVYALPSQVQTVTNKRNLMLIQGHLETALHVPQARGLVRFVGVPEECHGCGGKTVAGVLTEVQERAAAAAMGAAAGETLEERMQRRRTTRTFSRLKGDSSSNAGRQHSTGPPATTPAGPRPEPSSRSHVESPKKDTGSGKKKEQQSAVSHVETPSKEGAEPRRAMSLGHKKSLNFLQSLFHRSNSTAGQA